VTVDMEPIKVWRQCLTCYCRSILGDIAEKRFRLLVSMLPFRGLFVCLSVCNVRALCSNGRRYWHVFAFDSPVSLPDRVKIWLTSVNPFLPKFCPKLTHPCWFGCRGHLMANCGRMIRDNAVVTGDYHSSFDWTIWYHRWPPTTSPSSKCGSQMHISGPTSRRVLPPGEYDIDKKLCAVLGVVMSRVMSLFAQLLWPLLIIRYDRTV